MSQLPLDPAPPAPGAGVTATWNYTLGSIVFLFVMLDLMVVTDFLVRFEAVPSPQLLALLLLSLAAAAVRIRYSWFLRGGSNAALPGTGWTIALFAPAVASWIIAFVTPEAALLATAQLWFCGVLFACFLRGPARWWLVAALLAAVLLPVLVTGPGFASLPNQLAGAQRGFVVAYGVMLPFMLFTSLWVWNIVRRLDESRHLAAELAVTRERLRFAADLHDIQGHHLQVIALKAELAERTMASAPAQAAVQLGEIRVIAKEAMEETRSLVAGLRQVGLREELENASEVLTLAGAECTLDVVSAPVDPAAERVLAFAVREATTNILRHSDARHAAITLVSARAGFELSVMNDGADPGQDTTRGSGLVGLRERVQAVGGTLLAGTVQPTGTGSGSGSGTGTGTGTGTGPAAQPRSSTGSGRFELRVWVPTGDTE